MCRFRSLRLHGHHKQKWRAVFSKLGAGPGGVAGGWRWVGFSEEHYLRSPKSTLHNGRLKGLCYDGPSWCNTRP